MQFVVMNFAACIFFLFSSNTAAYIAKQNLMVIIFFFLGSKNMDMLFCSPTLLNKQRCFILRILTLNKHFSDDK